MEAIQIRPGVGVGGGGGDGGGGVVGGNGNDGGAVTWLMRERPPMPGGGDNGGEPNPLPVKRPEAENRDIALKYKSYKLSASPSLHIMSVMMV